MNEKEYDNRRKLFQLKETTNKVIFIRINAIVNFRMSAYLRKNPKQEAIEKQFEMQYGQEFIDNKELFLVMIENYKFLRRNHGEIYDSAVKTYNIKDIVNEN